MQLPAGRHTANAMFNKQNTHQQTQTSIRSWFVDLFPHKCCRNLWLVLAQSRHRYVRNLDLGEEMMSDPPSSDDADDARGPESYPNITPSQKAQLDSGLEHIRTLLDPTYATDREVREALWDSYFDVEGTIQWFLERREADEKAKKAREKQKGKTVLKLYPNFFSAFSFGNPPLLLAPRHGLRSYPSRLVTCYLDNRRFTRCHKTLRAAAPVFGESGKEG